MNITIKSYDSWSETSGILEKIHKSIKIIIPNGFIGFTNLLDYKNSLNKKYSPKKINQYFGPFLSKLHLLEKGLKKEYNNNIDPVEYLIYLYFQEGIDVRGISNRLEKTFSIKYPARSLNQNLNKNLNWELREHTEGTKLTKIKNRKKVESRNITSKNNKIDKTNELIKILKNSKRKTKPFDINIYNTTKNNSSRFIYLLDLFGYIQKEKFHEQILKLKNKYSSRIITNSLQNIIDEELNKNGIEIVINISNQRISEILSNR